MMMMTSQKELRHQKVQRRPKTCRRRRSQKQSFIELLHKNLFRTCLTKNVHKKHSIREFVSNTSTKIHDAQFLFVFFSPSTCLAFKHVWNGILIEISSNFIEQYKHEAHLFHT